MTAKEASSRTSPIQKKTRRVVKKPNPDDKTKALSEIDGHVTHLRSQLDGIRESINALGPMDKKEADPRTGLRKRLGELRDQQAANKKNKQGMVDQLNTLNASLKKKIADMKVIQDKLPFKSLEAVEAYIFKLNKQIESEKLKLVEEKRILAEISTLTKSKKTLLTLQEHQRAIDADKKAIADLKADLDTDQTYKTISDEINTIQSQIEEISKARDEAWKKRSDLFDERTRLQKELDDAFAQKKSVNDEYFSAVREHAKFLQEEQQRKRDEIQQRKKAELEEKRLAIAKEERELAEIPAFQAEITTCDNVYRYLLQFSNDQKRASPFTNTTTTTTVSTVNTNNNTIRQADMTANVPTGVMLAKKADKAEEVFFVGGGCKSKKSTKAPREKKIMAENDVSTTTATTTLKFPLAIVEQLFELKVEVPRSSTDLEKTLDALLEKSVTLKANQASATAENKRRAEERIAKLTLADIKADTTITSGNIEIAVERTEIMPEIEAAA
ncbi:hypothetical protein FBU30_009789 [Linnemannia zychae]|nr:hypothetical protein FBU30_009789 [Linnemannia zychae]